MEMAMNSTPFTFDQLSVEEMALVDGGAWGAKEWIACGLIAAGAACGVAGIWCPTLWGGTAKTWGTAAAILGGTGSIVAIR